MVAVHRESDERYSARLNDALAKVIYEGAEYTRSLVEHKVMVEQIENDPAAQTQNPDDVQAVVDKVPVPRPNSLWAAISAARLTAKKADRVTFNEIANVYSAAQSAGRFETQAIDAGERLIVEWRSGNNRAAAAVEAEAKTLYARH
jgi:hypothetical protein